MYDLVCFSHLSWNFVYQRPQHLMSRFARNRRVFYIEEPDVGPGPSRLLLKEDGKVQVAIPYLNKDLDKREGRKEHIAQIQGLYRQFRIDNPIVWYYTPMAIDYTRDFPASLVIYDCMDELSAFKGASPKIPAFEDELFKRADLIFTGGKSLYESKRQRHSNVYCFPSSIDFAHFSQARKPIPDPEDQAPTPKPRLGYYGVIDERMDLELLDQIATRRPEWQVILVGPVVKVEEEDLPDRRNIHYLGMKAYDKLPAYLSGWDVALLPFRVNEATRYLSPTKIPEYLAGGRPVVSTPIHDVVHPYQDLGLVSIAFNINDFICRVEEAINLSEKSRRTWLHQVDQYLIHNSWEQTWQRMESIIEDVLQKKAAGNESQSQTDFPGV